MTTQGVDARTVAIYARVSTLDQDADVQLGELRTYVQRRGWTLAAEHVDRGISGARDRRPALDALLRQARRRQVDVLLVWALDRLGRSLRHLVNLIAELEAIGVDLVAVTQPIDTTTPAGKLTFSVLGAVAEFERAMIRERVRAGIAKARASGKRLGRPARVLDVDAARAALASGSSLRAVARGLAISHVTLARALARAGTKSLLQEATAGA